MFCPVCNGMSAIEVCCPMCETALADNGRVQDFTGPYAPYLPIENDVVLLSSSSYSLVCKHVGYCPECNNRLEVSVALNGNIGLQSIN